MRELKTFDDCVLLEGYVAEAAWFWFDASTHEKRVEAGLHRILARCILLEIGKRGLDEPDDDFIYRYARRNFPLDDLRRR